jgi:hypothetical protein
VHRFDRRLPRPTPRGTASHVRAGPRWAAPSRTWPGRLWVANGRVVRIWSPNGSIRSVFVGWCGLVAQSATIDTSDMPLDPVQMPGEITTRA